MTPTEFKAWFDGFTEALDDTPSKKQWARIKERVAEIDGKPVTERVFVDRYLPAYPPRYWMGPIYAVAGGGGGNGGNGGGGAGWSGHNQNQLNDGHQVFCSGTAMTALGRADAASLSQ